MRKLLSMIFLAVALLQGYAQFAINAGKPLTVSLSGETKPVVSSALAMLAGDCQNVFGSDLKQVKKNADIQVEIGAIPGNQAFRLEVTPKGKLVIASSDAHGAAYGLLELSRLFGVSPWEWWADADPKAMKHFELPVGYVNEQSPSVEYRGIFINDEDWGLMPWSSTTMEPENERGVIGPKTTEKIFQLMLRLRANYYWPPMHECSQPFFLTEGNREMAKKYGIYIGGSHCEPMASSTAGEWPRRGVGEYDYVNNSDNVLKFWEDRLKDVADQEILFTLGMRGVHDGAMNGAKTIEEQKAVLTRAIADQRALLAKYGKADAPQVFIPYKEVLDVYHAGLEVPDDVCLMWCDDNYGYIRHFPTEAEAARSGGNGVYYHVSYWGRPHDHLWLCTQSPYLLYQQMKEAYDRGIQRMWILNVGDIKPCEYQTELFMDMAWNMEAVAKSGVSKHLQAFLSREFGEEMGAKLTPVMEEHYRLAYIRRPEFMGGTRTEESDRKYWSTVRDLPWSREYIAQRMADYQALSHQTEALDNGTDAYFQLVKYPVQGAAQLNAKLLYAQLARHGEADWAKSDAAYDSIAALTKIYNQGISNQGKWRAMMDFQPRKQPVFDRVARAEASEPMVPEVKPLAMWNAMDCTAGNPVACPGLGYEGKAAAIAQGSELHFDFDGCQSDSVMVTLAMVPTHPISADGKLRIAVSINGSEPQVIDYHTEGRSEEWKLNVLSNQAIRSLALPIAKSKATLTLRALDEGIILDQVTLYEMHTVFTIGDSTMATRDVNGNDRERGWAQMLQQFLPDNFRVENHAVCGRSSKSFIDEGRWQKVLDRLKPGDYVIIQFGHNDEKADPALHTAPGSTFDANLKRFITEARQKGATPILMNSIARRNFPPTVDTPHQYSYDVEGTVLVDTHGQYAEVPRQIALESNVAFVDMTALTMDLLSKMGVEKSKAFFSPNGNVDNTHLNEQGAIEVAKVAAEEIQTIEPTL